MFNFDIFRNSLNTKIIGNPHIAYYTEVSSTNNIAIIHGKEGDAREGTLIIAGHQTAGRGRYGRTWDAPKNKCILVSVIFRHRLKPDQVHLPNLIGALSIAQGIQDSSGIEARIKHPNDVRIARKKVAGVLTEMQYDQNCRPFFVLGFGVNVNITQSEFPQKLRETATSVLIATSDCDKPKICRETLLQNILQKLEANYQVLKSGEIDTIANEINEWEEKE